MWNAAKVKYQNIAVPLDAESIMNFVLSKVPESVQEAYYKDNMTMEFCTQSEVQDTSYNAFRKMGKSKSWAWWDATQTVGSFQSKKNLIQVSQRTVKHSLLDYPTGWKNHIDIAGHELGHYVDYICGLSHRNKFFLEAYQAERFKFDRYTANSPSEYFADCFWLTCMYPEEMKEELPETYAWFKEYLAN